MLLANIVAPLGFEFIKSDSLENFFGNWKNNTAFLNILDITQMSDLKSAYPNNQRLDLPPLWLITDQLPFLADLSMGKLADDFIPKPLSADVFQEALAFWTGSSPLFVQSALEKLAISSSEDLVTKILLSFNESLNNAMTQTFACLNENDLLGAAKACHAIKASAKLVGAQAIYNLCLWVEIKKRHHSLTTEKFTAQTKQIFLKSQKYFQILETVPLEKLLAKK